MHKILWSQSPYQLIEVSENGFKTLRTDFVCDLINEVTKEECDYVVYDKSEDDIVAMIKDLGNGKFTYRPAFFEMMPVTLEIDSINQLIELLPELLND